MNATISKYVALAYPDYLKEFDIYTNTTSKQLGMVRTQSNRPIAFVSQKLTEMQQHYSMTKIELLVIVETLKEFNGIL